MSEAKTTIEFKLSDPGSILGSDPAMSEYLRCYEFPKPPDVRYGFTRVQSERVALFGQAWLPDHAIGTILLIHGFSEHSGNYARLIRDFVEAKFAVAAIDLRGHGLSEGPRGHVDHAEAYAEDVELFFENIFPALLPHRPVFLWAHSLGSLNGLQTLSRGKLSVKPSAAVFSSPLLGFPELKGMQKIMAGFAPIAAHLIPSLPISHGISPNILSHDEEYLARRLDDPLMARVATPKWLMSQKAAVAQVQDRAEQFQKLSPTLFLLSGDELVTNLSESRKFAFQAYAGMKHKVIEFPGFYHEIEKEPDIRARVVSESLAWFRSHC